MHESLVEFLDRRFVSCYWNAFPGQGADPGGIRFAKECGTPLRYGAFATPEGKVLVSFGFDRDGFVRALLLAKKQHPELLGPTAAEKATLVALADEPNDPALLLAAAKIHTWTLDYDAAEQKLDAALESCKDEHLLAKLRYWRAHNEVLRLPRRDVAKARRLLDAIGKAPSEFADAIAMDRIDLQMEVPKRPGFYTGWAYTKDADVAAIAKQLESLLVQYPESPRRGQMLFALGLAYKAAGKTDAANAVWKRHFTELPEDRYALLSRVHHESYIFSPYKTNHGPATVVFGKGNGKLGELLQNGKLRGGVRVQLGNGKTLGGKEAEAMLKRLLEGVGGSAKSKPTSKPSRRRRVRLL